MNTWESTELYKEIRNKDKDVFYKAYEGLLLGYASYHDLIDENSYHMLLLGICLYVIYDYEIISNREEGKGRCDIVLKARRDDLPSHVIEFKYMKKEDFKKKP